MAHRDKREIQSLTVCIATTTLLGSSNEMMLQLWHYNTDDGISREQDERWLPNRNQRHLRQRHPALPFALVLPVDTTPPTLPSVADGTSTRTTTRVRP
jgi:hypothetical protein